MIGKIDGLSDDQNELVARLEKQLQHFTRDNLKRTAYFEAKVRARDVLDSMPARMKQLGAVLSWPQTAVEVLANRCQLQGFSAAGDDNVTFLLDELWNDNELAIESPQSTTDSMIHGLSWLISHKGLPGEPSMLVTAKDALRGTGLWNGRARRLDSFLSLVDVDESGRPSEFVLYEIGTNTVCRKDGNVWEVDQVQSGLSGRLPVERLAFNPRLGKPFGQPRISRAVMSYTDMALRVLARSEVTAELYSVPQRVVLGGQKSDFLNDDGSVKDKWNLYFGSVWALSADKEGRQPSVMQMQQATQQPHMDQLRNIARMFAGATSVPESSLGVSAESNPTSADGYFAAREDLIALAERSTGGFGVGWRNTAINALTIQGVELDPSVRASLRAKWRNPAFLSANSKADAFVKQAAVLPWLGQSDVAIEQLGFDVEDWPRLREDRRRFGATQVLQSALNDGAV